MANLNCKCGGKFITIDIVQPAEYQNNILIYDTIRIVKGYASWQCNKCYKAQKQKLRISKKTTMSEGV